MANLRGTDRNRFALNRCRTTEVSFIQMRYLGVIIFGMETKVTFMKSHFKLNYFLIIWDEQNDQLRSKITGHGHNRHVNESLS
jgi:hypothetical protein